MTLEKIGSVGDTAREIRDEQLNNMKKKQTERAGREIDLPGLPPKLSEKSTAKARLAHGTETMFPAVNADKPNEEVELSDEELEAMKVEDSEEELI
jgi:hypothetical protein